MCAYRLRRDFLKLHKSVEIPSNGAKWVLSLWRDCLVYQTWLQTYRNKIANSYTRWWKIQKPLEEGINVNSDPARLGPLNNQQTTWKTHGRWLPSNHQSVYDAGRLSIAKNRRNGIENIRSYCFKALDLQSEHRQIAIAKQGHLCTALEACGRLRQFCRIPFDVTNGVVCFQRVIDKIIDDENLAATIAHINNITMRGIS